MKTPEELKLYKKEYEEMVAVSNLLKEMRIKK
jgi:hypothetical protein